jgi:hypothetical protein
MSAVSTDRSIQTLTAADFLPLQNTHFTLTGGPAGMSLDAELAEVTGHAVNPSARFRAPFSVMFHGPLQPVLPQGIYRVEHERLGALELFIVPVGPDEPDDPGQPPTAMRYEAVFG